LPHQKLDKGTWRIQNNNSQTILVKYKYYARQLDGGSSYLDDSEAYINPITCLMYIPGKELLPVSLSIQKPVAWKIAVALDFDESKGAFVSENYHELVDAPILVSPTFNLLTFNHKDVLIEIALQGEAIMMKRKLLKTFAKSLQNKLISCKMSRLNNTFSCTTSCRIVLAMASSTKIQLPLWAVLLILTMKNFTTAFLA